MASLLPSLIPVGNGSGPSRLDKCGGSRQTLNSWASVSLRPHPLRLSTMLPPFQTLDLPMVSPLAVETWPRGLCTDLSLGSFPRYPHDSLLHLFRYSLLSPENLSLTNLNLQTLPTANMHPQRPRLPPTCAFHAPTVLMRKYHGECTCASIRDSVCFTSAC